MDFKIELQTLPFEIGKTYRTLAGDEVLITHANNDRGYECVGGNDGIWRYNRLDSDLREVGRVTGTASYTDQRNLVPHGLDGNPLPVSDISVEEEADKKGRVHGMKVLEAAMPDVILVPTFVENHPDVFYKVGVYASGRNDRGGHSYRFRKAKTARLDKVRFNDPAGHPAIVPEDEEA